MEEKIYRIGIAGASGLLGRELYEELNQSNFAASDIRLLDREEAAGTLEATDEEISIVQKIDPDSFLGLDIVFFTDPALTADNKSYALETGASVVDLTASSDADDEAVVRAPWIEEAIPGKHLGLQTRLVIPAHPAALMLALVTARLEKLGVTSASAMVFEPASQLGKEAMDELHQQTVNLLAFQSIPKDEFGDQAAFNMLSAYGVEARHKLIDTETRIRKQYQQVAANRLPAVLIQLIHAPVFHGYTASVLIELKNDTTLLDLEEALEGGHVSVATDESEAPNNIAAAGRHDVLVRVREESPRKFWLWLAADNLKLSALNAIACAAELQRLRPVGKVQ